MAKQQESILEQFSASSMTYVLLASIQVAGVGINITSANVVFIMVSTQYFLEFCHLLSLHSFDLHRNPFGTPKPRHRQLIGCIKRVKQGQCRFITSLHPIPLRRIFKR